MALLRASNRVVKLATTVTVLDILQSQQYLFAGNNKIGIVNINNIADVNKIYRKIQSQLKYISVSVESKSILYCYTCIERTWQPQTTYCIHTQQIHTLCINRCCCNVPPSLRVCLWDGVCLFVNNIVEKEKIKIQNVFHISHFPLPHLYCFASTYFSIFRFLRNLISLPIPFLTGDNLHRYI